MDKKEEIINLMKQMSEEQKDKLILFVKSLLSPAEPSQHPQE